VGLALGLVMTGCGGGAGHPDSAVADAAITDAASDAASDAWVALPADLLDTGLCVDSACSAISPGVREYEPRWALWSDGAGKRRWIYLPPGAQIDTSNMDQWSFPTGTRLWKEFTRDGVRVETRMFVRTGPVIDDWDMVAYAWNPEQTAAIAAPDGVVDALDTSHDIPPRADCRKCHDRLPARVLGFSALSLDHDSPSSLLDLRDLVAASALTDPPATASPYFLLPGGAVEQAALGYLFANCGHCHNADSDVYSQTTLELRLESDRLATLEQTPIYATSVGVAGVALGGATVIVDPGNLANSILIQRFLSTDPQQRMPIVATEDRDPTGEQVLSDWVSQMPN
jgi:hypothetical protein